MSDMLTMYFLKQVLFKNFDDESETAKEQTDIALNAVFNQHLLPFLKEADSLNAMEPLDNWDKALKDTIRAFVKENNLNISPEHENELFLQYLDHVEGLNKIYDTLPSINILEPS